MEDIEWSATNESKLLQAMVGNKPVGINKHIEMASILIKLHELGLEIEPEKIWNHLETWYSLQSLEKMEPQPISSDIIEFSLSDLEYGSLKLLKEEKTDEKNNSIGINKLNTLKRTNDNKDISKTLMTKECKKDEKVNKKESNVRRDSKDGKDLKSANVAKKEVKKENITDKSKTIKNRNSLISTKEEEKSKTPTRQDEKRQTKRPTRASNRPEETTITPNTRKSQSPLTITPTSAPKRRRI